MTFWYETRGKTKEEQEGNQKPEGWIIIYKMGPCLMCISVEYKVCCSLSPQAEGMNINDGILLCKNPGTNKTHVQTHTHVDVCVCAHV